MHHISIEWLIQIIHKHRLLSVFIYSITPTTHTHTHTTAATTTRYNRIYSTHNYLAFAPSAHLFLMWAENVSDGGVFLETNHRLNHCCLSFFFLF